SHQYERAAEQFKKTLELEPSFIQAHWELGNTYEREHYYDKAMSEFEKALELELGAKAITDIDNSYKRFGYEPAMREMIRELTQYEGLARKRGEDLGLAHSIARYHATLGDKKEALSWLQIASAQHHPWLTLLNVDPQFEELRAEPALTDLLRHEGLTN